MWLRVPVVQNHLKQACRLPLRVQKQQALHLAVDVAERETLVSVKRPRSDANGVGKMKQYASVESEWAHPETHPQKAR